MIQKKLFMAFILAGLLCAGLPANAQNGAPQKPVDPAAIAKAIQNCPGLNGKMNTAALAQAAQNCPGLNGALQGNCPALNGKIDPVALAAAAQNCPALNGALPPEARKCPAADITLPPEARKCPALQGGFAGPLAPQAALDSKVDKQMNRVVRALERNKRSADTLIQAARSAGADPNAVAELQKMSEAFRQVFMQTVSPQQIVESILAAPAPAETPQGIIITAPDGSTWLVTPSDQPQQPAPRQGRPPRGQKPQKGMPPAVQPAPQQGMQVPPPPPMPQQGMPVPPAPRQGMPAQPGLQPAPQGMPPAFVVPPQQQGGMPMLVVPQQQGAMPPFAAPQQAQPQVEGEMIIMEEGPQYMPLWPTKDDLGKDGVLKYLEKRSARANSN